MGILFWTPPSRSWGSTQTFAKECYEVLYHSACGVFNQVNVWWNRSPPRKRKEQYKQPAKPQNLIPLRKEIVRAPASDTKRFKNVLEVPHKLKQDSRNQEKPTSHKFNQRRSKSCLGSYLEATSSAEKVKGASSIRTSNCRQVLNESEDTLFKREDIVILSWNDGGNKSALRPRPQGGSQTVRSHKDGEAEGFNQQDVQFQQTVERSVKLNTYFWYREL